MKAVTVGGAALNSTFANMVFYRRRNGQILLRSKARSRRMLDEQDKDALLRQIARARRQWAKLRKSDRACWNAYARTLVRTSADSTMPSQAGLWLYAVTKVIAQRWRCHL